MDRLLNSFVERSKDILQENLAGIYLHGSAVMGCFNPLKSDIDLIIVVKKPLTVADRKAYMDMVVEANASAPAKGIEMSIVTADVCTSVIAFLAAAKSMPSYLPLFMRIPFSQ